MEVSGELVLKTGGNTPKPSAESLNKIIAAELGISVKTVEAHRARVMEKMGVGSVAELVQVMMYFNEGQPPKT